MTTPLIFAHRGASGTCPENTLLAFRRAIELGATWLELDVQLVEGQLVVFHDDSLERTTNGVGFLSEIPLAELRCLDAGRGERVPLLEEVLTLARGKARINIELKGVETGAATARLLERLFSETPLKPDDLLASSLRLEELKNFQQLLPVVRRAPIYEEIPLDFKAQLDSFGAWSVHLDKFLVSKEIISTAAESGCLVFAWTVNRGKEAERLIKLGVTGLFTDYPEKFIREN